MPETQPELKTDAAWHLLALVLVALLPAQLYFGRPVHLAPETHGFVLTGLSAAYLASALLLLLLTGLRRRRPSALECITTVLALHGILFLLVMLRPTDFSRGVVVVSTALSCGLAVTPTLLFGRGAGMRRGLTALAGVLLIATGVLGVTTRDALEGRPLLGRVMDELAEPSTTRTLTPSMLYNLEFATLRNHFDNEIPGGGIAAIGAGLFVMGGDGSAWFVDDLGADSLTTRSLAIRAPQNREAWASRDGTTTTPTFFRVTDVLVLPESDDGFEVLVAHSYWDSDDRCSTMRVSSASWASTAELVGATRAEWTTLYETSPCTVLESEGQGGRLVALDDETLLLSLGDFDYDGVKNPERYGQEPGVDYGKTVTIDRATGIARHFTSGHRNPQGLFRSTSGAVWSTEHGPRGGDELNLLRLGGNYGWPVATYGTAYFQWGWPIAAEAGSHEGFDAPFHSWLPSIGISNLTEVTSDRFPGWQGDLVIGSLRNQSLWRVRIRDEATAYVEQIVVGVRIRDLIEAPDGRLVLWSDDGDLVFIDQAGGGAGAAPTVESGAATFAVNCSECHSIDRSGGASVGPDLYGIVGRPVAADRAYSYSPALAGLEGVWSRERLADFLRGPMAFAEGTRMAIPGMTDEAAIEGLLLYLETMR